MLSKIRSEPVAPQTHIDRTIPPLTPQKSLFFLLQHNIPAPSPQLPSTPAFQKHQCFSIPPRYLWPRKTADTNHDCPKLSAPAPVMVPGADHITTPQPSARSPVDTWMIPIAKRKHETRYEHDVTLPQFHLSPFPAMIVADVGDQIS
ncbi:hypothetical protein BJX61DRAFT_545020 [Aspergillus egyptiacus]|nr:hypothetical protein BJX61DRAFT_545020 [Aspergillus egyptiacus]